MHYYSSMTLLKLPASDVLKYILADRNWIAVHPSGTEPKIKIYYSIKDADQNTTEAEVAAFSLVRKPPYA